MREFESLLNHSFTSSSRVAQWKRVGLITQRSEDRNLPLLRFWRIGIEPQVPVKPNGTPACQASLWPSGLRRAPAKCVGSARTSSNLVGVAFYIMVSWPSGLRRSTQVRVYICRRGFESHRNHNISGPVAQWIARKTSNLKVAGSSPARVVLPRSGSGFEPYKGVKP